MTLVSYIGSQAQPLWGHWGTRELSQSPNVTVYRGLFCDLARERGHVRVLREFPGQITSDALLKLIALSLLEEVLRFNSLSGDVLTPTHPTLAR